MRCAPLVPFQVTDLQPGEEYNSFHRGGWVNLQVFRGGVSGVPVIFFKPANHFFRGGRIYGGSYDELEAYLFFSRAVLEYFQVRRLLARFFFRTFVCQSHRVPLHFCVLPAAPGRSVWLPLLERFRLAPPLVSSRDGHACTGRVHRACRCARLEAGEDLLIAPLLAKITGRSTLKLRLYPTVSVGFSDPLSSLFLTNQRTPPPRR